MRNSLPLLSRPLQAGHSQYDRSPSSSPAAASPIHDIPTIRFIGATPSEPNVSLASIAPFSSSPLAPKESNDAPRKRLVPKKSKLGLLGGNKTKATKDLSEAAPRVNGDTSSTGRGGFEIYVDQTEDPDIGDIVVVKKKKSRLALDGMRWGPLGEVTNVPSTSQEQHTHHIPLKPKGDETQKWWSISRGRKELKDKENGSKVEKHRARSKTPEPFHPTESRSRFNSLEAGISLFGVPLQPKPHIDRKGSVSSMAALLTPPEPTHVPIDPGLLAATSDQPSGGSIAVRAMRSMRSLARMKSWATISSTHPNKEGNDVTTHTSTKMSVMTSKTKEKSDGQKRPKQKEKKTTKKTKEPPKTVRLSGSSFEIGGPSPPSTLAQPVLIGQTMKKKQSILGLGLPSSIRSSSSRHMSNASTHSASHPPVSMFRTRVSSGSAHLVMGADGRPSSTTSSGSSLRPPSTASGISVSSLRSPRSSSSSAASVRWDEQGLQNVKEMQRRERQNRRESGESKRKTSRESRHSSESHRRVAIADVFPELHSRSGSSKLNEEHSIVIVEEATCDGHDSDKSVDATPIKKARPRPMSDQMAGRARPKPINADEDGVLSILDAATNDLASLINRLDLEATPASNRNSPLKHSSSSLGHASSRATLRLPADNTPNRAKCTFDKDTDAPLLASLRGSTSISTIRAFSQTEKQPAQHTTAPATRQQAMGPAETRKLIGQPIVPWSSLNWQVSPKRPMLRPKSTVRPTHGRSETPAPALEPPPVFQPLRPATRNRVSPVESLESSTPVNVQASTHPSSQTFGSDQNASKIGRQPSMELDHDEPAPPSPSPPFKRGGQRHSSRSSVLSAICDSGAILRPDALKSLGLTGTLGGKDPEIDPEDEDSDIPDELQCILSGQSDDESINAFDGTLSSGRHSPPPMPGLPPLAALPLLQDMPALTAMITRAENIEVDFDDADESPAEDDTKQSFDFTSELRKLNNSGGSDRRSFVEQLESAFRTPAHMELDFDIKQSLFNKPDIAPLAALSLSHRGTADLDHVPRSVTCPEIPAFNLDASEELTGSRHETSVCDTLDHLLIECEDDIYRTYSDLDCSRASVRSKESDGKLNRSFRFGGKLSIPDDIPESPVKPLSLSDIIPPLSRQSYAESSMVDEDSSVLRSILAQAFHDDASVVKSIIAHPVAQSPLVQPQARIDSNTSSKRYSGSSVEFANTSGHSRNPSEASFTGFESFDEVRRAFEFGPNRPAFYPPPGAASQDWRAKHESVYSIASVSSFGAVLHSGTYDPFGYSASRPVSEDMTGMSMTVDDTFSFMQRKIPNRSRVDSDASSFYFGGAGPSHPKRRSYYYDESNMSIASNGPPISLYNRSHGAHRRSDSCSSASAFAQPYAAQGSHAGRAAWARHRQETSVDSITTDYSVARLGRPGVGDKMFDMEYGMPLEAISASPAQSSFSDQDGQYTTRDSIFGTEQRLSGDDSLFDKTDYKMRHSDDNVFDADHSQGEQDDTYLRVRQFRPLSMLSVASTHSAPRDDDTMISMLGGGHVRRRSVDSGVDGSPCINLERERKKTTALQHLARVLRFDVVHDELPSSVPDGISKVSPDKVVLEKPSIASTSSQHFGDELVIVGRRGLLERQHLDDNSLLDDGKDLLASLQATQLFSRPIIPRRPRSNTCGSSSGADTPPLSTSDNSSISSGSQSSIDIGHLNAMLTNIVQPTSGIARARARARGAGHRRRISQACVSRSSVYETIEEESIVLSSSPSLEKVASPPDVISKIASPEISPSSVYIVDPETILSEGTWNEEHGIVSLRRYAALREEAQETVTESKKTWEDTPFSVFAVQSFCPPMNITAMHAMLEHSKQHYGPLPSELRPHRVRSRTSSRPSPYPLRARSPPEHSRSALAGRPFASPDEPFAPTAPTEMPLHRNIPLAAQQPSLDMNLFCLSPAGMKPLKAEKATLNPPRLRIASGAKRSAPGGPKRSGGKSSKSKATTGSDKENFAQSVFIAPSNSLRLSRPRPRGRLNTTQKAVPAA